MWERFVRESSTRAHESEPTHTQHIICHPQLWLMVVFCNESREHSEFMYHIATLLTDCVLRPSVICVIESWAQIAHTLEGIRLSAYLNITHKQQFMVMHIELNCASTYFSSRGTISAIDRCAPGDHVDCRRLTERYIEADWMTSPTIANDHTWAGKSKLMDTVKFIAYIPIIWLYTDRNLVKRKKFNTYAQTHAMLRCDHHSRCPVGNVYVHFAAIELNRVKNAPHPMQCNYM